MAKTTEIGTLAIIYKQDSYGKSTAYARSGNYVIVDETEMIPFFVAPESYFNDTYEEIK